MSLAVMGQGSHDGSDTLQDEGLQSFSVGLFHIAHISEVYRAGTRIFTFFLTYLQGYGFAFARTQHVHVGTGQSQGVHACCLQPCHEVLVHQSAIDHGHHLEHLAVGDASAVHHLALDAQPGSHLGGTAATPVHKHFVSGDSREMLEQLFELRLVFHHGASHFDDCQFVHCRVS